MRKQERCERLAVDVLLVGLVNGLGNDGFHLVMVERIFLGDGVADDRAALEAQIPLGLHDLCDRLFIGAVVVELEARGAAIERGQFVGTQSQNRHALCLEVLERQAEIQQALCTRADDAHRGVCQLLQVGGNVHRLFRAAVHAADTAGSEEADARHGGDHHGGGDGGGAGLVGGEVHGHVAAADLAYAVSLAHDLQLLGRQADLQLAADDGGGGGNGALSADDFLNLVREFNVLRIGHTVAENGGFERDDGLAGSDSLGDLGGDGQILFDVHSAYSFRIDSMSDTLILGLMVFSWLTAAIPAASA